MLNSAFGVDFGNQNFLVSMQKNGSIDVVLNESSKRLTPTMISVDNDRRYAGEAAMSQYMMNLTGTITNMKRLVGLKYQSSERENIEKLVPYRLIELENGLAGVLINYKNDSHIFRIEQIISMLFNNVLQIARENSSLDDEFVTVVSPWWNEEQRRIIIDAAKICGCSQVRLLNSTTAAAIAYLFYHKEKLPSEQDPAIYSAIVDFGDSSLNVSITEMKKGYLRVKSISCDNTVGGSDFTQALAKYIINIIQQKYKIDPRSNPKAMIRLYSAVEKLKKGLTVNPVMSFEVQSLMNDIDVSFLVKREEFEDQIQNLIEKIRPPVESAIEKAGIPKEQISVIEIHGGASRVPAVKMRLKEIFGKDPTQSLNPDECFAIGAGFQAVSLCSQKYHIKLDVKDACPKRVYIEWTCPNGEQTKHVLFDQFDPIPSKKIVPIKVQKNSSVRISNDDELIGNVELDTQTEEILNVRLTVKMTMDCLIEVHEAEFTHEEEVEQKDGDNVQKKTIKKRIGIKFNYQSAFGLSQDEIQKYKDIENNMKMNDENEKKIDNMRNDLESLIYQTKNVIQSDLKHYYTDAELQKLENSLETIETWFNDNEFERMPYKEYDQRYDALKKTLSPGLNRKDTRELTTARIQSQANKVESMFKTIQPDSPKEALELENNLKNIMEDLNVQASNIQNSTLSSDIEIPSLETKIAEIERKLVDILSNPQNNRQQG